MNILRNNKNSKQLNSLVEKISSNLNLNSIDVYNSMEFFIQMLVSELKKSGQFKIPGILDATVYKTKPRKRVLNGETFFIDSENKIKIVFSKELKDELNK